MVNKCLMTNHVVRINHTMLTSCFIGQPMYIYSTVCCVWMFDRRYIYTIPKIIVIGIVDVNALELLGLRDFDLIL